MFANNAQYHRSCGLTCNNTKLQIVEMRALKRDNEDKNVDTACKCRSITNTEVSKKKCFYSRKSLGTSDLHEAAIF